MSWLSNSRSSCSIGFFRKKQFNESIVRHHFRKKMAHMSTHILKLEVLKHRYPELWNRMRMVITSESLINPSRWYLRFLGLSPPVIAFCSTVLSKTLLISSQIEKNFYNFAFRKHSGSFYCLF